MNTNIELAQRTAKEYWQKSENTFVAKTEYYNLVENIIDRDVIPIIKNCKNMLDVGCGSGRFTLQFANVMNEIIACDLSETLIDLAKKASKKHNINNVKFNVVDIVSQSEINENFEVLSCMGVLSTIISDLDVDNVLDRLVSYIQPGGYLILRDTLSTKKSQRLLERIPPAVYRSRFNYGSRLAKRGLVPVYCARVWFWENNNRENILTVMQKPKFPFKNVKFRLRPQSIFASAKKYHF